MILLLASLAHAAEVGGYLRVMTRPDLEGGDGRLGYWNLYGRLLNEGPYAALELRQDILDQKPGTLQPWTAVHAKIEGGTVANADAGGGSLAWMKLSQLYVQAGNIGLRDVTWRLGTLEQNYGDLGLYDMKPTILLHDTLGAQARYRSDRFELTAGLGDAGWSMKPEQYNTIFTGAVSARLNVADHLEVGVGAQGYLEPMVLGNKNAPHITPGLDYESWVRGEVLEEWERENPGQLAEFPNPEPTGAQSGKAVAYLGGGGFGPWRWSTVYASYAQLHPKGFVEESYDGETVALYVGELTDERSQIFVGTETQLALVPDRWDLVLAGLYGHNEDGDNDISPSDDDRTFMSAVVRTQVYLSPAVHLLVESSIAEEVSHNGATYRNHKDSIFSSSGGAADGEGLEYGDSDTRHTWQGKGGIVLNPLGPGIYTRPSLRLLYGVQYSTQNNAFGNSFVETLDQYNDFGNVERHWHNVVALEAEAWF